MKGKLFQAVFINADLDKAGSFGITKTPNAQSNDTSSTLDKDDETKQTRNCVDSLSMDRNDSKQKTQEYFPLSKSSDIAVIWAKFTGVENTS